MTNSPGSRVYRRTFAAAVLCLLIATSAAQAQLDISRIVMTMAKSHIDGTPEDATPWCFEIWVDLNSEGTLDHIDVTKPGGGAAFASITKGGEGEWSWDAPADHSSLANLQVDYPLGVYTFEFRDAGDGLLRTVNLDSTGLTTEPTSIVDFTYPSTNGQTGVSTNPTLTWSVAGGAGDALLIWLFDDVNDQDVYTNLPAAMTTTSCAPGTLQGSRLYDLEISVVRLKDWVGPGFPTATVTSDQFEYVVMIEHLNELKFTTSAAGVNLTAVHPVVNQATGHIMLAFGYDDGTLEFRDWQGTLLQVRYGFDEVTALSAHRYGTSPLPRLFVASTDTGGALRVVNPANINDDIDGRFGFGRITVLDPYGNGVLVASSDSGGTLRRLSKTDLSDLAARYGFSEITAVCDGWDTTNGEYLLVASTDSGGTLRCLDWNTLVDTPPLPRYGWGRIYALSSADVDGDGNAEIVVGSSDSGGAIRFIELPNLATDLAGRYGFGTVYDIAYGLLGVAQEQGNDKASIVVASSDGAGAFRVIEVTRSTLATTMGDAAWRFGFGTCVGMGLDDMVYQTGVNVIGSGTTDGGRCAAHIMDENLTDLSSFSVP